MGLWRYLESGEGRGRKLLSSVAKRTIAAVLGDVEVAVNEDVILG